MSAPNDGHGWIRPRPDGRVAKCGGPTICRDCGLEAVAEVERLRLAIEDLGRLTDTCVQADTGHRCP